MEQLKKFWSDEQGLETVEYAIMAGLIVIGAIIAITTVGNNVAARFGDLGTATSVVP